MKKIIALILMVLFLGLAVFAYAQEEMKEMKEMDVDPAAELVKAVENGKTLFNDKTLGTSGMTCNSCHMEGGTKDNPEEMMGMKMDAFDNLGALYPQFVPMAGKVMTLAGMVNFCIVKPLGGEALAWDDQKLTDLTAYCASVEPAKEEKKEEK